VTVGIPGHLHTQVIEPRYVHGMHNPEKAVREALDHPIHHCSLSAAVEAHQKVAIVFSDITRATPYHLLIPALLDALSHLPDEHIVFFCATGTHRPATPEELHVILGKEVTERFRIVQNDASDPSLHHQVGTARSGNRILMNREILEYDLRILTGFIEPHFFAGFSGGGKAMMPGMASLETVRTNHSIQNLENPQARWGITSGDRAGPANPIWEEIMEAAEFASPLFLMNITLNRNKEITGIFAGDLRKAHQKGCAFAKETAMVELDRPFDIVVTSNSGYPLDLNIYQSVKGMSAAERIVKKGGSIIMAAECWDGTPSGSDYETILKSVNSEKELMDFIQVHEKSLQDTWQVYFQAMIQMKADVYLYSSLKKEHVEAAHLRPVEDMTSLISKLAEKYGPGCRICVLPEGPHTIPYIMDHGVSADQ